MNSLHTSSFQDKLPLITIITVVKNGREYIQETMDSVFSQEYKNIEYIIVDGDSTDNTHKIIEKYKKNINKIIIKKDKSMYEALSTGFKNAGGRYFLWLNSDDFLVDKNSLSNLHHILSKKKL